MIPHQRAPDVFNIAITRNRKAITVLHALTLSQLPLNSLLRSFLLQGSARPKERTSPDLTINDLMPTLSAISTSGEEGAARYSGENHLPLIINDYLKKTLEEIRTFSG